MKRLINLTLIICSVSFFGVSQTPPTPAPKLSLTFEYENECGSPLVESMLWESVEGKVTRILSGDSIEIRMANHKRKRVSLAAVDSSRDTRAARTTLANLVLNRIVSVLVNPSDTKRTNIIGVVHSQTTEINRALIETGVVAYREPPFYSMSRFSTCVYQILERKAREGRLCIWQNGSR